MKHPSIFNSGLVTCAIITFFTAAPTAASAQTHGRTGPAGGMQAPSGSVTTRQPAQQERYTRNDRVPAHDDRRGNAHNDRTTAAADQRFSSRGGSSYDGRSGDQGARYGRNLYQRDHRNSGGHANDRRASYGSPYRAVGGWAAPAYGYYGSRVMIVPTYLGWGVFAGNVFVTNAPARPVYNGWGYSGRR